MKDGLALCHLVYFVNRCLISYSSALLFGLLPDTFLTTYDIFLTLFDTLLKPIDTFLTPYNTFLTLSDTFLTPI